MEPQRKTGDRDSKGSNQDEEEGLEPRIRDTPRVHRSGEGWSRNQPQAGGAGRT